MELICRQCASRFRAAVRTPLSGPVRVVCPGCGKQMVLRPAGETPAPMPAAGSPPRVSGGRRAVIADEPREFRRFLGEELSGLGFDVTFFDSGEGALEFIRSSRAELVVLNVYLKGKLGVEISEEIKADASLSRTRIVLIGALFRANRFRANPTNLYGADEYIEDQIPSLELRQIVGRLFPELSVMAPEELQSEEYDEARRLARLILSDIVIYNTEKVDRGIREGTFFEVLKDEIREGREYYETRVPVKVRRKTDFFHDTIEQFVQMKREELEKAGSGPAHT
ncbi:MAG TPA: response regulator [Thermoanaerobaculia bacterium]|nr:response regulator [Thermoanaerobaculia bacterium]